MPNLRPHSGLPELPAVSPSVAAVLPYGLARRLSSVPVAATTDTVTVLTARASDPEAMKSLHAHAGREVSALELPLEEVDRFLDLLSGQGGPDENWLREEQIKALCRLADIGLNLGQSEAVRPLVDRALHFAPYSAELWLAKARLARRRDQMVKALEMALTITPRDRRIVGWLEALVEQASAEGTETDEPPWLGQSEVGASEEELDRGVSTVLAGMAFRAARLIVETEDQSQRLARASDVLMALTASDSVSIYLRTGRGWVGHSTEPALESRMPDALPKGNGVAAQVMRQGIPVVVCDTAKRAGEIGGLVNGTPIRSFAVIPLTASARGGGLVYVNYNAVDQAGAVLDPDVRQAVEVVLHAALDDAKGSGETPRSSRSIDRLTDAYSLPLFEKMLEAELDRSHRYGLSVSLALIEAGRESGTEAAGIVSHAIRRVARASDVIARCDDGAFAIMLPQTTRQGALAVSRRIERSVLDALWLPGDRGWFRIGIATFPDDAVDADKLLSLARSGLESADGSS